MARQDRYQTDPKTPTKLAFDNVWVQVLYTGLASLFGALVLAVAGWTTFNLFFLFVLAQDYKLSVFVPYTIYTSIVFSMIGVSVELLLRFWRQRTMYDNPARIALLLITLAFSLDMAVYIRADRVMFAGVSYYDQLNLAFGQTEGEITAYIASGAGTTLAVVIMMTIARPITRLAARMGVFPRTSTIHQ